MVCYSYSDVTNEPILPAVAPHFVDCEFRPLMDRYRKTVEGEVVDRLGRPTFFESAVNLILGRIAARIERQNPLRTAGTCATGAPQKSGERNPATAYSEEKILNALEVEVRCFAREIELQFVATGILELPAAAQLMNS